MPCSCEGQTILDGTTLEELGNRIDTFYSWACEATRAACTLGKLLHKDESISAPTQDDIAHAHNWFKEHCLQDEIKIGKYRNSEHYIL